MLEVEYSRERVQKWRIASQFASRSSGMNVSIRRAEVSDGPRIKEMHQRLSRESVYYRYLRLYEPTLEDLQDLCSLEEKEGIVLIATADEPMEKVIGIACYYVDPQNPESAEPAILVEDDYQGCGVGRKLLENLFQSAIMLGVTEFNCYTLPSNRTILHLIDMSGLRFKCMYSEGMNLIRVWLNRNPENRVSA